MKQFFKFMFASIAGTVISVFVIFFLFFLIIGGIVGAAMSDLDTSKKVTKIEQNSILHMEFNQPIVDRGADEQLNFDFGPFKSETNIGLNQILAFVDKAKDDDKIKGIFLDVSSISGGMATIDEIRNALIDFKTSGKWIVSYSEGYSQKAYYLASVSDEIYVYPEGGVDFKGLSVNIPFLKGMLDNMGVEPQIIRGSNNKFKSAVEPFILDEMSQANRAQTEQWLGTIWGNMLAELSVSRDIPIDSLQALADGYRIRDADDAVENGLATATAYYDEVVEILKTKSEREADDDVKLVAFNKYLKSPALKKDKDATPEYKKKKIAVIYATGGINSGKSGDDAIGSETFAKAIKEAREDSTVKAIVLRVNSGGGSALASDVIWRETTLAKATKPFVVSMGDVAASGGYYISADADKIFAMPNTITGSIGVFGIIPNFKGLVTDKIGMTFDGVKTADLSDFAELTRPLTEREFDIIQTGVDRIYNEFLDRVSEGRDMPVASIDEIGQGRVWSGTDASQIGLVDEIGGLNDAIEAAAELAGLEEYRLENYPEREDPFEAFIENFNAQINAKLLAFQFGDNVEIIKNVEQIMEIKNLKGIQARIPYVYEIK